MIKKEVIGLLLILLLILTPLKSLKAEEKNILPGKIPIHKDQKKSEGEKKRQGRFLLQPGSFCI